MRRLILGYPNDGTSNGIWKRTPEVMWEPGLQLTPLPQIVENQLENEADVSGFLQQMTIEIAEKAVEGWITCSHRRVQQQGRVLQSGRGPIMRAWTLRFGFRVIDGIFKLVYCSCGESFCQALWRTPEPLLSESSTPTIQRRTV